MEMNVVDEPRLQKDTALVTPKLHAVTPEVKLKEWDGVPPYAVLAFIGYLLALTVLFSGKIVPYCEATFAQPQNCVPIFDKIVPVALAAIVLGPAIGGAVQRMGGNRYSAFAFSVAVTVLPPLMLGWRYLLG